MYYLLIDKFGNDYLIKSKIVICNKEQATKIARELRIITVLNEIKSVCILSMVEYWGRKIKKLLSQILLLSFHEEKGRARSPVECMILTRVKLT